MEQPQASNRRVAGSTTLMRTAAAIALCAGTLLGLVACGGGGGGGGSAALPIALLPSASPASPAGPASTSAPAANSLNSMALTVSGGTDSNAINLPQVSVQICAPGTSTCQTIDNVLLDTGSTGIRIASAALGASLRAALPQETVNGTPLDACQQFLDGYTWGTMRVADVTLGPKSAASQPLQIVGDPSAGTVPAACTDNGTLDAENTPAELGTNGVIGVASFLQDCGAACAQSAVSATYYACPSGGQCQSTAVPIAMQAQNIVANFAQDNNGVVLSLPAISSAGQGVTVGTLYFGVGTQANNAMTGATVLKTDRRTLRVSASYKNASFPDSFLDSGSNFFFLNDSTIAQCSKDGALKGFYCPANPLALSASFATAAGSASDQSFAVASAQSLFTNNPGMVAVDNIAVATNATSAIDFGLPFFYGKLVAVLNEGQSALGQPGPFTALAPR
ncbi:DUF3443 domain-containing protein [Variovorax sp. ZS18.2.2]|uniref:DUF3443 domain-containing protein n=1 Tax=Variovorax sp. ZS18.2.2 TaxID=2971255 RepID=UPI002150AFDC|nr:DUF3443 domain-containing protein [Variovorax sp. ZS18.2.2]MCR6476287.1 DUF3443 domain-containing protein [Variovorax sp. ZS18.2.2]